MNITLWVLQILLALHTIIGAIWKFFNSSQTMPSLQAIPHTAWLGLGVFELVLGLALIIPAFYKPSANMAPVAALCIAATMVLYCILHLVSGDTNHGQIVYWLVVAAICTFIAYGRFVLKPL